MKANILYLNIEQCSQVSNKKVYLQDVAEIYAPDEKTAKEAGEIVLCVLKGDKNQKIVFSAMKVIELIQKKYPELEIENIGEKEFVLEYRMPTPPRKGWEYFKTGVVMLIVFFGAAFTIMTFNTDVSVGDVFDLTYKLVMGTKEEGGTILELMYCIGLGIGILGFYNHFSRAKLHDDPTPIHIEMCNYEEEMNKAIIKDASREGKCIK